MPRLLAAPMAAALAAVLLLLQACAANATTAPRRLMKEPSVAKAEGPRPIDDGLGTIAPDPVPATGRFGAQLDELHGQSKHGVYEAHGYGYGHIGYGYGSYGGYGGPAKVHSFLGKPVSSDPPALQARTHAIAQQERSAQQAATPTPKVALAEAKAPAVGTSIVKPVPSSAVPTAAAPAPASSSPWAWRPLSWLTDRIKQLAGSARSLFTRILWW